MQVTHKIHFRGPSTWALHESLDQGEEVLPHEDRGGPPRVIRQTGASQSRVSQTVLSRRVPPRAHYSTVSHRMSLRSDSYDSGDQRAGEPARETHRRLGSHHFTRTGETGACVAAGTALPLVWRACRLRIRLCYPFMLHVSVRGPDVRCSGRVAPARSRFGQREHRPRKDAGYP